MNEPETIYSTANTKTVKIAVVGGWLYVTTGCYSGVAVHSVFVPYPVVSSQA